ncbi:unnamed protein product [Meganyctiphanes norvegica]|uniref:Very long-chain fatty acid transport protein n=1 Tax=Meganyctiphanes norvegica TaxID=48144 RepID=A0AAV2QPX5_MEGNR
MRYNSLALGTAAALYLLCDGSKELAGIKIPFLNTLQIFIVAFSIWVSAGGHYTLWLAYKTLPRDALAVARGVKLLFKVRTAQLFNRSIPYFFAQNASNHPEKTAIIFDDQHWTFRKLDECSNRVGHFLLSNGIKKGDTIALFMEARPEYVAIWLGCTKIGVSCALINCNLKQSPLIHSISIANAVALIAGEELQEAVSQISDELKDLPIWVSGCGKNQTMFKEWLSLDVLLESSSTEALPKKLTSAVGFSDRLLYIYTSGTTGMPKAAIINNGRFLGIAAGLHCFFGYERQDIFYIPLPLYHSTAGIYGMGQALVYGNTVVIRKKFSASQYWTEAKKHGCTAGLYIGEICRFLLNTPPKPEDKTHKMKKMVGVGLRPQIWEEFTERFNIPKVFESYGSTEGNIGLGNIEGVPGKIGFIFRLVPGLMPYKIIKVDKETNEPIRDKSGLCILCKPGEPGEIVGLISKRDPLRKFHGYADKKATEKKIIENVLKKGDCAYASGDIIEFDELGYCIFKDRTGDTFRWRGENVSTQEVEDVVSRKVGGKDVAVFGVEVPSAEGKAGMAVITDPTRSVDLNNLLEELKVFLPSYARPVFIRLTKEIDMTGTLKIKKTTLQKQGYDLSQIDDPLYFLDSKQNQYLALTPELHQRLLQGKTGL